MKTSFIYYFALFSALVAVSSCQVDPISSQPEAITQSTTTQNLRVAATAKTYTYRNFTLTVNVPPLTDPMREAFETDIDRIYNSYMKTSIISLMTKCPIILAPSTSTDAAIFSESPLQITLPNAKKYISKVTEGGPVLMHDLVHYYARAGNTTVSTYYALAKKNKIYASDSKVLSNVSEYLALSVTAYFGTILLPPYNRTNLTKRDPSLATYISNNY